MFYFVSDLFLSDLAFNRTMEESCFLAKRSCDSHQSLAKTAGQRSHVQEKKLYYREANLCGENVCDSNEIILWK